MGPGRVPKVPAARAQITSSVRAAAACRQRHPNVQAVLRACRHHGSATPGDHIGGYRPQPFSKIIPSRRARTAATSAWVCLRRHRLQSKR
jgi:hypothetical protein